MIRNTDVVVLLSVQEPNKNKRTGKNSHIHLTNIYQITQLIFKWCLLLTPRGLINMRAYSESIDVFFLGPLFSNKTPPGRLVPICSGHGICQASAMSPVHMYPHLSVAITIYS